MLIARKRKYNHKTLLEKCQSLKYLEKEMSNKDVVARYSVPRNTLSTWVKNQEKLSDSLGKGINIKRQKLRIGNLEMVEKAIFSCSLTMQFQNVSLSAAIIQEKALTFAKELNVENFQASDGWL